MNFAVFLSKTPIIRNRGITILREVFSDCPNDVSKLTRNIRAKRRSSLNILVINL
jgi:hypothetical protein